MKFYSFFDQNKGPLRVNQFFCTRFWNISSAVWKCYFTKYPKMPLWAYILHLTFSFTANKNIMMRTCKSPSWKQGWTNNKRHVKNLDLLCTFAHYQASEHAKMLQNSWKCWKMLNFNPDNWRIWKTPFIQNCLTYQTSKMGSCKFSPWLIAS